MRGERFWVVAALAMTVAACDDDGGVQDPATTLTAEEAEDVAGGISELVYMDMAAEASMMEGEAAGPLLSPADTAIYSRSFELTRSCPQGGAVAVAGTTVAQLDRATLSLVLETQATRTHEDCVLPLRRQERWIELDSGPNVAMSARFERAAGMPAGAQTVALEGGFDWQVLDTDRAGTCEIDVDIVWERTEDGGYRTVDGRVCGTAVHSQTAWSADL